MGFLKEKTKYEPTGIEKASSWIVTVASGLVVAWWILREWLPS